MIRNILICFAFIGCLWACEISGTDTGNPAAGDFVSDNPVGESAQTRATADTDEIDNDNKIDPARLISEADLIQVRRGLLYALSEEVGLTVIDISKRDQLRLLGRYRIFGRAFEMYLNEASGTALVLYNNYHNLYASGYNGTDENAGIGRLDSGLVGLDVSDPAAIAELGTFELPGYISDSRRVGDILYVVTAQDEFCYGCQSEPNTTVTSLSVKNARDIQVVDQLHFAGDGSDVPWRHPVSLGDQRIYVGSDSWSKDESARSFIDVVDIADSSGKLVTGARVPVAGAIQSRWQMDERDGVLRVISQTQSRAQPEPPIVETFRVDSSQQFTALGRLVLELPRAEFLRSVSFDGARAYAITAVRTDPLFTLDLSDPSNPRQLGELEMPGWIYHMQPLGGDRLLGFGFEEGNSEGALHASLFDVSDLSVPRLLTRVHFGGASASFPEDQDRIHKAIAIEPEAGVILVPFEQYDVDGDDFAECPPKFRNAIALIDLGADTLDLRGVASIKGTPRRAVLHDTRLISVSNETVQSFDIDNRDVPEQTANLRLSRNVHQAVVLGDKLVRLSTDANSNRNYVLDVVALDDADNPTPLGEILLDPLLDQLPNRNGVDAGDPRCYFEWADERPGMFAYRDHIYALAGWGQGYMLSVFDLSDATNPRFVRSIHLPFERDFSIFEHGLSTAQDQSAVLAGDALVFGYADRQYAKGRNTLIRNQPFFAVLDLRDPDNPKLTARVARPDSLEHGGVVAAGNLVLSSRIEKVGSDRRKVRIYLDRLDPSDPANPKLLTPLNVPGILVDYDSQNDTLVTLDVRLGDMLNDRSCYQVLNSLDREDGCYEVSYALSLLGIDGDRALRSAEVSLEGQFVSVSASSSRVIYARVKGDQRYDYTNNEIAQTGADRSLPENQLLTFERSSTALRLSSTVETRGIFYSMYPAGENHTLFVSVQELPLLYLFNTAEFEQPSLQTRKLWGRYCSLAAVTDTYALCVSGGTGVQRIDF